jgi:two-component system response regulator PilR (NtrC family)
MEETVLLADDELMFRETLTKVLEEEGMSVTAVANGTDALDAITVDIQMPGADGIKVLRETMKMRPDARVIMITAHGTVELAVEAIKLGACEYVVKPVIFEDILIKIRQQAQYRRLRKENIELKQQLSGDWGIENIIGTAPAMQGVFETIRKVAKIKSNVLITGDSGTGKELVARAIHSLGSTGSHRFVAVNCSAIPEGLLESELFGHKKGSFTSAVEDKKGFFEIVDGGTLFLDEIGYMPMSCQVKLLRAVEEKQIIPVGSTEPVEIDLRLIVATNRILENEIKAGRFREDLYYRINVVGIHLPLLRERREDIPELVKHFINKYNVEMGKNCTGVTDDAMQILMDYEWKGNIRELQNVIERAIIFAEGEHIRVSDIGLMGQAGIISESTEDLYAVMRAYEREHIVRVLNKHKGNKAEAAKGLGVGLSSLYRKICDLKIDTSRLAVEPKRG